MRAQTRIYDGARAPAQSAAGRPSRHTRVWLIVCKTVPSRPRRPPRGHAAMTRCPLRKPEPSTARLIRFKNGSTPSPPPQVTGGGGAEKKSCAEKRKVVPATGEGPCMNAAAEPRTSNGWRRVSALYRRLLQQRETKGQSGTKKGQPSCRPGHRPGGCKTGNVNIFPSGQEQQFAAVCPFSSSNVIISI